MAAMARLALGVFQPTPSLRRATKAAYKWYKPV